MLKFRNNFIPIKINDKMASKESVTELCQHKSCLFANTSDFKCCVKCGILKDSNEKCPIRSSKFNSEAPFHIKNFLNQLSSKVYRLQDLPSTYLDVSF